MVREDPGLPVLLPRLLFIVSTSPNLYAKLDLYAKLKLALATEPSVEIHLDRREGQRRSGVGAAAAVTNRRRAERRQQAAVDAEIHDRGWAVVKVSPDRH